MLYMGDLEILRKFTLVRELSFNDTEIPQVGFEKVIKDNKTIFRQKQFAPLSGKS